MRSFHSYLLALALSISVSEIAPAESAVNEDYPIVGTWQFNKEATEALGRARDFLARTETYVLNEDGQIEFTLSTVAADGSSSEETMAWSARGGITPPDGDGHSYVEARISPGRWLVTYLLADGSQQLTLEKVVSMDGRTMHQTWRGFSEEGQPFEVHALFDRQ